MKDLQRKLQAVEYLRYLKQSHTYRELSERFGLPITVLSRYISGTTLPAEKNMGAILTMYRNDFNLEKEVEKNIVFHGDYFDNTRVLYNTFLLRRIAQHCRTLFGDVDKIFTSAADGIPLASRVADVFKVDMVYAKQKKEVGVKELLEESYIPSSSGNVLSLYLPKNAIRRGEDILIVDDVIRSGETQRAMIDFVTRNNARVHGIFTIIAVKKSGLSLLEDEHVEVLIQL